MKWSVWVESLMIMIPSLILSKSSDEILTVILSDESLTVITPVLFNWYNNYII